MKPQFETYRYVGEICRQKSQSIVECRLSGSEISTILAVHAVAAPTECTCLDGEIQYGGRLVIGLVYEDGNKKVCRAERGAEFFHKAENALVSPSCFCRTELSSENVTWRREGSGLYVSVVVDAAHTVYGNKQLEYLASGDGLITKSEPCTVHKLLCAFGETEGEDEFETECVGDILLHSEQAAVRRVAASNGQVEIEGDLALHICVLKSDEEICSYERLIPFRMQIPSEEAFGNVVASARVFVKAARLSVQLDEETGAGKTVVSYCLSAECALSVQETITVATDAFSLHNDISLEYKNDEGRYLTKHETCIERISGAAVLGALPEGEYRLCAAVLPRAEVNVRKGERGAEVEGAVLAEVLLRNDEGSYRTATLTLPFAFPAPTNATESEAQCAVCGLNIRRRPNGETEAEAVLRCNFSHYEPCSLRYISEATEGEARADADSAFSVFVTNAGEELWTVAKRLGCSPEELQKSNPKLEFPLRSEERIFVYRQLTDEKEG